MAATATAPARRKHVRAAAPQRRPFSHPQRAHAAPRGGLAAVAVGTVSGIADSGVVLGLTRSRLWIGLLASLLVGIVALNVMALSFNAASSKTAALSDELREQNSALRANLADGLSNERLQSAAQRLGLVMPQAASALMLTPDEGDAEAAARRLERGDFVIGSSYVAPLPEAAVTPVVDPAVPAATEAAEVAPVEDPTAEALATSVPDPAATPAETSTPVVPEAGGGVTP